MLVFSSDMQPKALVQNKGRPFNFTCDFCGTIGQGFKVQPDNQAREDWAVLPEEWAEFEDRRDCAKKQFMTCCESSECRHSASRHSG